MAKSVLGSVLRLASVTVLLSALLSGCTSGGGSGPMNPAAKADMSVAPECATMKCENPSAICCGGEPCIDVLSNTQHCGGCGKTCRSREACNNGNCVCAGGGRTSSCKVTEACCSDGCHDILSDTKNCGGCGVSCKEGEVCDSGQCKCGPSGIACKTGQICCGSVCSDRQNDAMNCGMCGKACKAGKACKNGLCEGECVGCTAIETCCDGTCVNLLNNQMNCGMCGNACKVVLGIPLPCLIGICSFSMPDMGARDM
ncbi:MAG TPA: hypothetical protein PK472_05010 [Pseudomonadota bacterium]|jgi:hypothetical protein|nr:hypothetical protein [Pseudomonadota bacterium]